MYLHPQMGRLLAQAKLEEAKSRMRTVAPVRAAALEQQQRPVIVRGPGRRHRRAAGEATTTSRWRPRRPSFRPHAPKTG